MNGRGRGPHASGWDGSAAVGGPSSSRNNYATVGRGRTYCLRARSFGRVRFRVGLVADDLVLVYGCQKFKWDYGIQRGLGEATPRSCRIIRVCSQSAGHFGNFIRRGKTTTGKTYFFLTMHENGDENLPNTFYIFLY